MRTLLRTLAAVVALSAIGVCTVPVIAQDATPAAAPLASAPPFAVRPQCAKLQPTGNHWTFFAPGQFCRIPYLLAPNLPLRQNGVPVSTKIDDPDVVDVSPSAGVTGYDGTPFVVKPGKKEGTANILFTFGDGTHSFTLTVTTKYAP